MSRDCKSKTGLASDDTIVRSGSNPRLVAERLELLPLRVYDEATDFAKARLRVYKSAFGGTLDGFRSGR